MESQAPVPSFSESQKSILSQLGISVWSIPTHATAQELLELYRLATSLPPNAVAVEVGSYIGASTIMIANGLRTGGTLYCVDTWQNDAMSEGAWNTFEQFKQNTIPVEHSIITIRSDSSEAGKSFTEKIDFLFIDGDHNYAGVKRDVEAWFDKLKPGGIIVMHDIGWAEGVIKVVAEDIVPHLTSHNQLPNMFWGIKS